MEIIQRIGPCNAKIKVGNIEDVRVSKRNFVVERAKELLKTMTEKVLPDSQELADEVAYSVRVMEIQEYGKDRLPAGPAIDESDEIIVVEGRADVLNLLKHGIKNTIAMNGTSTPQTIIDLSKKKTIVTFVDGDRGGNLILKELTNRADIDFVCRAPDGKEVEEITKKEIHMSLRARIAAEQVKMELGKETERLNAPEKRPTQSYERRTPAPVQTRSQSRPTTRPQQPPRFIRKSKIPTPEESAKFKSMLEDLIGTRGAYILDEKLNILGKVPISELTTTIKSLSTGIYAVVFDGTIEKDLIEIAEKTKITYLIAMDSKVKSQETRANILTADNL